MLTRTLVGLVPMLLMTGSAFAEERKPMRELPVPVQAYLLKEAVHSGGILDPFALAYSENPRIAFIPESDLNLDGEPDYAVWPCFVLDPEWNYDTPPAWRMSGNPCGWGVLIISQHAREERFGPMYNFIELSGVLADAKADPNEPQIIVRQRQFNENLCGETEYACDMVYRLIKSPHEWGANTLELVKACKFDECRLSPH